MKKIDHIRTVVFSGGCYSGKTTTMLTVKKMMQSDSELESYQIITLDEIVRNYAISSIDDIRKDARSYLRFQNDVVRQKIEAELDVMRLTKNTIVLIDRSITDSLFYVINYIDKASLNKDDLVMLHNLISDIISHINHALFNIYNVFVRFKPLNNVIECDTYRPNNLDMVSRIEYMLIDALNTAFISRASSCKQVYADLNKTNVYDLSASIIYNLKLQLC